MNYKKKNNKKIIISLFVSIVVILISLVFKSKSSLSILEVISKDIGNTVVKIMSKPINFIIDKKNETTKKDEIYNTYEALKSNEDSIKLVLAQNENLKKEINELKSLNNISIDDDNYQPISASVIKRNVGYWNNFVTIDKGLKDGVVDNMAVITSDGLVGITTNVSNFYSDIKLLTSDVIEPKISVQVKSNDTYIPGILDRYNVDSNTYIVEGISEYDDIDNGSYIYTTSYNSNIPGGVLVGQVVDVKKDEYDLAKIVIMKSFVDFDNLRYVDVLVDKNND